MSEDARVMETAEARWARAEAAREGARFAEAICFYRRTLALVRVNGIDVGEQLIAEGAARRWMGRRQPWC